MILSKIIVSYFSIRTRFVTQSDVFNIGKFEFKVVGGRPWQGRVTQKTELYCYDSYSYKQNIRIVTIAPKL